jgi:hypothetical protein
MTTSTLAQQQQAARNSARRMTFAEFSSMGSDDYEEEGLVDGCTRYVAMRRDENGNMQVYGEFVFDNAGDAGDDDATGTGWQL